MHVAAMNEKSNLRLMNPIITYNNVLSTHHLTLEKEFPALAFFHAPYHPQYISVLYTKWQFATSRKIIELTSLSLAMESEHKWIYFILFFFLASSYKLPRASELLRFSRMENGV
jgi:hypothetical protein